jgi:hypothetical protein
MTASLDILAAPRRGPRRQWWLLVLMVPAGLAFASWWLTEPLTDRGAPVRASAVSAPVAEVVEANKPKAKTPVSWPEGRLDGAAAKSLLLDVLAVAAERLDRVETYTATFHKQERMKDQLGAEQTLAMKVRQKPFAIYFKFLSPQAGKEVVYAEGHHDNKLIAHSTGVSRFLVPRLAVAPDHPIALADSRHPVTEAGLANLTSRLLNFRRMDLDDADAVTVFDRLTDAKGRARLRSVHTHPRPSENRPFARIEVLYDPETWLPIEIRNFDWPKPGHTGELLLAEHYAYENLNLDASLTAVDFDPANPAYAFHRY